MAYTDFPYFAFSMCYVIIACLAIPANITILTVYLRNKPLLKTGAFVISLSIGDIIYTCGHLFGGISRSRTVLSAQNALDLLDSNLTLRNNSNNISGGNPFLVHGYECIWNFPICWLIGSRIQSLSMLSISIDRLLAVEFPVFYFTKYNIKKSETDWRIASMIIGFAFLSALTLSATMKQYALVDPFCFSSEFMEKVHILYQYNLNMSIGK